MVDKYDLVYRSRGYDSWREMVREQDGDWVRAEDHEAELAALRAERDDLRAENELLQEQVMATQRDDDGIDALRARIAELEAAGRAVMGCNDQVCACAPNRCEAQCRADEMLRAALRASASAGPVQTNIPKGAVSVVKPQGTEETGTDRPAAPVLRCDHCGHEQPSGGFAELGCPKEYFDGISDVKCLGWMRPVQRQGTGEA